LSYIVSDQEDTDLEYDEVTAVLDNPPETIFPQKEGEVEVEGEVEKVPVKQMGKLKVGPKLRMEHFTTKTTYDSELDYQIVEVVVQANSGTEENQYSVKVAENGLSIDIIYKIDEEVMDPEWITIVDPTVSRNCTRYQAYKRFIAELKLSFGDEAPHAVQTIAMPFEVDQEILSQELNCFEGLSGDKILQLYVVKLKSVKTIHKKPVKQETKMFKSPKAVAAEKAALNPEKVSSK